MLLTERLLNKLNVPEGLFNTIAYDKTGEGFKA